MAVLSNRTFLMKSTNGTSYTMLVPIMDFPDLGGQPENVDVTCLNHMSRVYIPGIQETEPLVFTVPYDTSTYTTLAAESGDSYYSVWFGGTDDTTPTGSKGKFDFKGELSLFVQGKGVNEAQTIQVTIFPSTGITATMPA